jgi:hypothetical protein
LEPLYSSNQTRSSKSIFRSAFPDAIRCQIFSHPDIARDDYQSQGKNRIKFNHDENRRIALQGLYCRGRVDLASPDGADDPLNKNETKLLGITAESPNQAIPFYAKINPSRHGSAFGPKRYGATGEHGLARIKHLKSGLERDFSIRVSSVSIRGRSQKRHASRC